MTSEQEYKVIVWLGKRNEKELDFIINTAKQRYYMLSSQRKKLEKDLKKKNK